MPRKADRRQIAKYMINKESMPKKQAALKAGYALSTAERPSQIEASMEYKEMLALYVPKNKLLKTLTDGLEATKTVMIGNDESSVEVDYAIRHKYMDTGFKLHGLYEVDNRQKAPVVNVDLSRLTDDELRIRAEIDEKSMTITSKSE